MLIVSPAGECYRCIYEEPAEGMCGPLQEFNKRLIKSKVRIRIATLFAEKKLGAFLPFPLFGIYWTGIAGSIGLIDCNFHVAKNMPQVFFNCKTQFVCSKRGKWFNE